VELEMQVTGSRTVENNFGKGWGSPRSVMPEEEGEGVGLIWLSVGRLEPNRVTNVRFP
jgi:hypothetical protein